MITPSVVSLRTILSEWKGAGVFDTNSNFLSFYRNSIEGGIFQQEGEYRKNALEAGWGEIEEKYAALKAACPVGNLSSLGLLTYYGETENLGMSPEAAEKRLIFWTYRGDTRYLEDPEQPIVPSDGLKDYLTYLQEGKKMQKLYVIMPASSGLKAKMFGGLGQIGDFRIGQKVTWEEYVKVLDSIPDQPESLPASPSSDISEKLDNIINLLTTMLDYLMRDK